VRAVVTDEIRVSAPVVPEIDNERVDVLQDLQRSCNRWAEVSVAGNRGCRECRHCPENLGAGNTEVAPSLLPVAPGCRQELDSMPGNPTVVAPTDGRACACRG